MRNTAARSSAVVSSAPSRHLVEQSAQLEVVQLVAAGGGQEVVAADEGDDVGDAGHAGGQQRRHGVEGGTVGKPHAVPFAPPAELDQQLQGVAGDPDVAGQVAQHVDGDRAVVAEHLGHPGSQAVGELQLRRARLADCLVMWMMKPVSRIEL
jgi:hypothetical protein